MRVLAKFSCVFVLALGVSPLAHAEYEKNFIGEMETYTAKYEDTLIHLARTHDLGFIELFAANPKLDPWIPGEGAKITLPKRHLLPDAERKGVVINLPEMRLYGYLNGDDAPFTYPIGIGREGLDTPLGKTTIVRKKEGPTWYPTQRMRDEQPDLEAIVPPGPENPLGTHALYLGWPTYLMHGTNKPFGIGRRVSSGCMRFYPEDVIKFYEQVPIGTQVNIINQPVKVAWIGNDLYIEAHPDMDQALEIEVTSRMDLQPLRDEDIELVVDRAGKYQDNLNWPRVRMALRERKGYPIRIARHYDDAADELSQAPDSDAPDDDVVIPLRKPKPPKNS